MSDAIKIPQHLAIIMDGNGRWAKARGYQRTYGHLRGARVAKNIIELCAERGVKFLTLYAFSSENWMRPFSEVSFLMQLLARHLRRERATLLSNNIRFQTIGDVSKLPEIVQAEIQKTIDETAKCSGMTLIFALSYGSRQEITNAVRLLAEEVKSGVIAPEQITPEMLEARLETANIPNPDLIIRTSGEYRLSNFMLWQASYSELYIADCVWPNFNREELQKAFEAYSLRERRFGKTSDQVTVAHKPAEQGIS
jgi:undecaprenyl diphosphate synthase